MKIVILIPTRGRPSGLMRLYDSIVNTITNHSIVFAFYVDSDDVKKPEYESLSFTQHPNISIMPFYGPRQIIAKTFNQMADSLMTEDIYFMNGADDMFFNTKGWDEIVSKRIVPHPYALYYFDDGIQHECLATFAIVSDKWVRLLGYFFPESIRHNYTDTYIFDVARRAGTLVYIPEVTLTHLHYTIDSSLYDRTYQEAEQHWDIDRQAFDASAGRREEEAQMIISMIR